MIGKDLSAIRLGLAVIHEALQINPEILWKIHQQNLNELIEGVLDIEVYRIIKFLFENSAFPCL